MTFSVFNSCIYFIVFFVQIYTANVTFQVKHFSKYGLPDESDDEDVDMLPKQPPVARQPTEGLTLQQQQQALAKAAAHEVCTLYSLLFISDCSNRTMTNSGFFFIVYLHI